MDTAVNVISMVLFFAFIIFLIWGVTFFILELKRSKEDKEKFISMLTDEQKHILADTPYRELGDPNRPNAVIVRGLIMEAKEKGKKTVFKIIFYDRYFPNADGLTVTNIVKLPVEDARKRGMREGVYVDMLLNEDKTPEI